MKTFLLPCIAWLIILGGQVTAQVSAGIYSISTAVSDGILNMRSGPGQGYSVVVAIPAASDGVHIGQCQSSADGKSRFDWCMAEWNGYRGWVSSCCIVFAGTEAKQIDPPTSTEQNSLHASARIVADKKQFVVNLKLLRNDRIFFCSGSIVDVYTVLTAAHCITSGGQNPPDSISISLSSDQTQAVQATEARVSGSYVGNFTNPTAYVPGASVFTRFDIAILKTSEALTSLGPNVTFAALPTTYRSMRVADPSSTIETSLLDTRDSAEIASDLLSASSEARGPDGQLQLRISGFGRLGCKKDDNGKLVCTRPAFALDRRLLASATDNPGEPCRLNPDAGAIIAAKMLCAKGESSWFFDAPLPDRAGYVREGDSGGPLYFYDRDNRAIVVSVVSEDSWTTSIMPGLLSGPNSEFLAAALSGSGKGYSTYRFGNSSPLSTPAPPAVSPPLPNVGSSLLAATPATSPAGETKRSKVAVSPPAEKLAEPFDPRVKWEGWEIAPKNQSSLYGLVAGRDGRLLTIASETARILVWDIATGKLVNNFATAGSSFAGFFGSFDGSRLLLVPEKGAARLLDAQTGVVSQELESVPGQRADSENYFQSWDISSDNQFVVMASSDDKKFYVWDAVTGKLLLKGSLQQRKLKQREDFDRVRFSRDGNEIIFANPLGLTIVSAKTGEKIKTLFGKPERDTGYVASMEISPDGKALVLGKFGVIQIWDLVNGRLLRTLDCCRYHVDLLAFAPDGHAFVSGGADPFVKIWNVDSGELIRSISRPAPNALRFSLDGMALALIDNSFVKLFDPQSGSWLSSSTAFKSNGFVVLRADGSFSAQGDLTNLDVVKGDQLIPLDDSYKSAFMRD
jgi:WD40 repeat protein/uncharacterized protein YraI